MLEKYILITGASAGIGYALAKEFAKNGRNLILVSRRKEKLEEIKKELLTIELKNIKVEIICSDLASKDECNILYEKSKEYNIEAWINNAGVGYFNKVENTTIDQSIEMIATNIEALTILSLKYINDYRDVENAQLINISSTGGYDVVKEEVIYCGTKFFVSAFTEGLALEMTRNKSKVKVKIFAPFVTETEFAKVAYGVDKYDYNEHFKKYSTKEEVARLFLDLYNSNEVLGIVGRHDLIYTLQGYKLKHI